MHTTSGNGKELGVGVGVGVRAAALKRSSKLDVNEREASTALAVI